jgi:hypothetical protein
MKRTACTALALGLLGLSSFGLTGCQTSGRDIFGNSYLEDRLNDTIDIMPMSFSAGEGLYVGARVTAFVGTGVGWAETERFGWSRRTPVPGESRQESLEGYVSWPEQVWGGVLAWQRSDDPAPGAGNTAFFIPMRNTPSPSDTLDVGSLLDVEADIHLWLFGVRVALAPVQFADWLLGWANVDFLDDDLHAGARAAPAKAMPAETKPAK